MGRSQMTAVNILKVQISSHGYTESGTTTSYIFDRNKKKTKRMKK